MLSTESNMAGGFGDGGSPLLPPLLLFAVIPSLPLFRVMPAGSFPGICEREGGRQHSSWGWKQQQLPHHVQWGSRSSELLLLLSAKSAPTAGGVHAAGVCMALPLVSRVGTISPESIQNLSKGNNYCVFSDLYFCCIFS